LSSFVGLFFFVLFISFSNQQVNYYLLTKKINNKNTEANWGPKRRAGRLIKEERKIDENNNKKALKVVIDEDSRKELAINVSPPEKKTKF
jgi:hypothetical protein